MDALTPFIQGLASLDKLPDPDARRAVFSRAMTALSAATSSGASPLDVVEPATLLRAVQVAQRDGVFRDPTWIRSPVHAVAVYEMAQALPLGAERLELSRSLLAELYRAHAGTFATIATRMASTSARGLTGAGIRARVALCLSLPLSSELPVDPLALALACRPDLSRTWIQDRAVGSLPERRLAARILERAARITAERYEAGDVRGVRLFRGLYAGEDGSTQAGAISARPASRASIAPPPTDDDQLKNTCNGLLSDRETLVWRHLASARGLLFDALPALLDETESWLDASMSPTEWRRGATSMSASIAVRPDRSVARCIELARSPIAKRDPGVLIAMVWGCAAVAQREPDAVDELLLTLAECGPLVIAESLLELCSEVPGTGAAALSRCRVVLGQSLDIPTSDIGLSTLASCLHAELTAQVTGEPSGRTTPLTAPLQRAIAAFATEGAEPAHVAALLVLDAAAEAVSDIERDAMSAQRAVVVGLRALDSVLLQSGMLNDLLLLNRRGTTESSHVGELDVVRHRLGRWLLSQEHRQSANALTNITVHQRQLRVLLHLVDTETPDLSDDPQRRASIRGQWIETTSILVNRLAEEPKTPLRRSIAATVARAMDALVRDGVLDPSQALLYAGSRCKDPNVIDILAEASRHPGVRGMLHAYSNFARETADFPAELTLPPESRQSRVEALRALAEGLPSGVSPQAQTLSRVLLRMADNADQVIRAAAIDALDQPNPVLGELFEDLQTLARLQASAGRRLGAQSADSQMPQQRSSPANEMATAAFYADPQMDATAITQLLSEYWLVRVPPAICQVVLDIGQHLSVLPKRTSTASPPAAERPLPPWMPKRRTLGGYYVHSALGHGSGGTVFLVSRSDERDDPSAERFALKVPEFDASAARSLTEAEFYRLFRQEAGTLLTLPEQENLARFVTFDAGARPKPILVMELVEGMSCDRAISNGPLATSKAFDILDGILLGLTAMHTADIGHLDIKPANVILRGGRQPVLVDFGLSGRHIRPGCGTGAYGAPEVWGLGAESDQSPPMPADMYSFGCVAFEVLTGKTLFDAESEVALLSAHLSHDGLPPRLMPLMQPPWRPIGELIGACLRRSPPLRLDARSARDKLRSLRSLGELPMPPTA